MKIVHGITITLECGDTLSINPSTTGFDFEGPNAGALTVAEVRALGLALVELADTAPKKTKKTK